MAVKAIDKLQFLSFMRIKVVKILQRSATRGMLLASTDCLC